MNLEQTQQLLLTPLKRVEEIIQTTMASEIPLISEINQHIIQGGKRIRPITGLLISGLLNNSESNNNKIKTSQLNIAAIIEFVHTATLLHDDVVDNSEMRRGQETANTIWGNEASVLVGDFLYSRAFQLLIDIQQVELMQELANASNQMAEGEVLQLMNRHNPQIDEETYYQIIHAKTAVLFQAACTMSAMASPNNTPDNIQQASEFGKHLGLAFQLVDDALDYQGNNEQLGKNIGDDLVEGKATLPLIHCLSMSSPEDRETIENIIATGDIENPAKDFEQIQSLIQKTNSVAYTIEAAKAHSQKALKAIEHFRESDYKKALHNLVEFVTARLF